MSESTTQTAPTAVPASYQLLALDEAQMRAAHQRMIDWAIAQQDECDRERAGEEENERIARNNGWGIKPFRRRIGLLAQRHDFYQKIEHALRAGYVIVPNFAMDVFAIRTDAESPRPNTQTADQGRWISPNNFTQNAKRLELGDGRYVSPDPELHENTYSVDDGKGGKVAKVDRWAAAFTGVNFPMSLAKPMLMEATATAMQAHVFDEIGVAQDQAQSVRGDPIIVGRILNPRRTRPAISFFIGWYFDPSAL